jgi:hypothetical protein
MSTERLAVLERRLAELEERLADEQARGNGRPPAHELAETPGALLTRKDLFALGYKRPMVDAILRECAVIAHPDHPRLAALPSEEYRAWRERHTYRGNRVRPT